MERAPRRYGFACTICRKRKVRCDGTKPQCSNCSKAGETCTYQHSASVVRLQNALAKSERHARKLEHRLGQQFSASTLASNETQADTPSKTNESHVSSLTLQEPPSRGHANDTEVGTEENRLITPSNRHEGIDTREQQGASLHYGPTSRFSVNSVLDGEDAVIVPKSPDTQQEQYHRRWLTSNTRFQSSLEQLAYSRLQNRNEMQPELATILLKIYWTWQAPLHNCVYRRCFFRDMAIGGSYFSDFLLLVIYAHACRHIKANDARFRGFEQGEVFLRQAKSLLVEELGKKRPQIPTIQGLLILGGRQCAIGKDSEGWLYTGMAIRMLQDLGLHLYDGGSKYMERLEPDDLEARKRLFLSAYVWDKSISLCLGRSPSLQEFSYPQHCLFDMNDDNDEWRPFYIGDFDNAYPTMKSFNSTTFSYFCELATIIKDIYGTIYSNKAQSLSSNVLAALEGKLRTFHDRLPVFLKMDTSSTSTHSLPPHTCCLNILYHTLLLLVYRPFLKTRNTDTPDRKETCERAHKVCTEEAAQVNLYFQAYGRSFNNYNQTYLLSYCVYTAATVEVQQLSASNGRDSNTIVKRLATTLNMLEAEARQTPGIRRSVDIIKTELDRIGSSDYGVPPTLFQYRMGGSGHDHAAAQASMHLITGENTCHPSAAFASTIPVVDDNATGLPQDGQSAFNEDASITRPPEDFLWQQQDLDDTSFWHWSTPDASGGFVPNINDWLTDWQEVNPHANFMT